MADSSFLLILLLFFFIKPMVSVQPYDPTPCIASTAGLPHGSTYICNSNAKTCNTYVVYRPQFNQTLFDIATLFNVNESQLHSTTHFDNREVIVPIICDCPDWSSRAIATYTNVNTYSFSIIACGVYQGLVNPQVVELQNANHQETSLVNVPVKCACTNTSHETGGTRYLVTYPVMDNDTDDKIAQKFGVTRGSIQEANGLGPKQTIFGGTTLLVPTTGVPVLNLDNVTNNPSPQDTIPINGNFKRSIRSRFLHPGLIVLAIISVFGVLLFLVFLKRKYGHREPPLESVTGSEFKPFSLNFLDGMSKYLKHSLTRFSLDELRLATQDFSECSFIGKSMYKGRTPGGVCVAIEDMDSIESAHRVVYILTTINHFNVVKLEGCCIDMNKSYLVFEFAKNGSLRDCLQDSKTRKELTWEKRVKIAFDLAEGLHYLHYSTTPAYIHRNISSGNVLITADWRAKISGFKLAMPIIYTTGVDIDGGDWTDLEILGKKGYLSPEYLNHGRASTKVDVYAYGVVLLELLSANVAASGRKWSDHVGFLADGEVAGESPGCLEKFKVFMDADLEGEYGLGDAMCLALLAKCCIQDDPQNRPAMNDVLRALSRIL